ncbi:MAG: hypothetical protein N2314_03870 [Brevinematales bacterium]|nr:hypothetical protein [Brevinematales bacterium]
MKKLSPLLLCGLVSWLFAVQSVSIPLFQWERIQEYELSNLVLSANGELSLSPSFSTLYTSENPLWCATGWKHTLVVGTAEGASLLWISGTTLQSNLFSEHAIISAIAGDDNVLYVGAIPQTTLYVINSKREIEAKYPLSPAYLWSIVPSPYGIWVLTGEPAEVYLLRGNKLQKIASLSSERHLLKGVWTEDGLYLIGESSFLYLLTSSSLSLRAVAEFSDPIQDITTDGKTLYVGIQRTTSRSRRQNGDTEKQEILIYRYEKGSASLLTTLPTGRLSQLFFWQKKLYIGSTQNFFVYDMNDNSLSAWGYGKGGIRLFAVAGDRLHCITERPGKVLQVEVTKAKEGKILTPLYDAGQKASWGKILGLESIPPLASVMTRSTLSPLPDLFEEWSLYQKQVTSQPNRYLQIQFTTTSPTPFSLREICVTTSPLNQAPEILRFDVSQEGERLVFSWTVRDPNQDNLLYTLSLKRKNGWVPLFSSPLTNSSLELSSRMFPEGGYSFLLSVEDTPSNPPSLAFTTSRESGFLTIDHTPPQIRNMKATLVKNRLFCEWSVFDLKGVSRVWYSLSPLEWKPILPEDGLCDSQEERFTLVVENFTGGYIQIKAEDIYGNEHVYGQWVIP